MTWTRTIVTAIVCLTAVTSLQAGDRQPFDAATWKDSERCCKDPYPRQGMADDLIATSRLVGLDRQQVLDLLGEPERSRSNQDALQYFTGPERGFMPIDSEWLRIQFGSSGKAVSADLVTD